MLAHPEIVMMGEDLGVKGGVYGVTRRLGMLPSLKSDEKASAATLFARSTSWVRAPQGGLFIPETDLGKAVQAGTRLGTIADPFGRYETTIHSEVEGLVIDKTANVANMRWILEEFCKAFFEVDSVTMRFRPSFFPFTEPSFEVDIQCDRSGPIVKFGEGKDWMEILGCGMVHPNVLRAGGLDPEEFVGFAFGMGLQRVVMLRYGIDDIRQFMGGDKRFLAQFPEVSR